MCWLHNQLSASCKMLYAPISVLQKVSDEMIRRRYAKRTIQTYIHWIRRFILFHQKRHPETMGDAEVEALLNQPLSLILKFVRSQRPRNFPVVLTEAVQKAIRLTRAEGWSQEVVNAARLRHSLATRLLASGTDTRTMKEPHGHNGVKPTQTYTHVLQTAKVTRHG